MHHRARQSIKSVFTLFAIANVREMRTAQLHLLDQQRSAIGLRDTQCTSCLVQELAGTIQRGRAATAVDTILKREVRVADRLHELVSDDRQRADSALGAVLANHLLMNARVCRHPCRSRLSRPIPCSLAASRAPLEVPCSMPFVSVLWPVPFPAAV